MTIYCGVDFHARQQTICYGDPADGEVCLRELRHDRDDVRGFYAQFTGDVVVGLEASGYSTWFVELLEGLGHQVFIGSAWQVLVPGDRQSLMAAIPEARAEAIQDSDRRYLNLQLLNFHAPPRKLSCLTCQAAAAA